MSRWIPVKEKLPKLGHTVMVCRRSGFDGAPLYSWGARIDEDSNGWLWGIATRGEIEFGDDAYVNNIEVEVDDDYEITHWVAMPRPPYRKRLPRVETATPIPASEQEKMTK